jgi:uncharacterized repeat protein (TIGR03803 family)
MSSLSFHRWLRPALAACALVAIHPPAGAGAATERPLFDYAEAGTISACLDCQGAPAAFPDGALYGTTVSGGARGRGTLFRYSPAGGYVTLYAFGRTRGPLAPVGDLVVAQDGNLYGVSAFGGKFDGGTVYRVTAGGSVAPIHSFARHDAPDSLMQASDGRFYGTTRAGGTHGHGTIFRLDPDGRFAVLHEFRPRQEHGADMPATPLLEAGDGWLYGTALGGENGTGCVYRIDFAGTVQVVHAFGPAGSGDAEAPDGRLILGRDGALYGTALQGGDHGLGAVYRISPEGRETVLHSFAGADGVSPMHGLSQDAGGDLYGVALGGGASGAGTAWRLSVDGRFEMIHDWQGAPEDGRNPVAMMLGPDGVFYGVTAYGGRDDDGTFFGMDTR